MMTIPIGVRTTSRQRPGYRSPRLLRDNVSVCENARTICTSRCREIRSNDRLCNIQEDNDSKPPRNETDYDQEVSDRILQAALPFVHQHGWSNAAISQGAETLGYAGVVHGMFPRGGFDLVNYFYLTCNEQLVEYLKQKPEKDESGNAISSHVIVEDAVKTRLEMIIPYISRWPEALALSALPRNMTSSLAALLTMMDDICFFAGDRSVDLRWYVRRVGLAGVYRATELYLLQDQSQDYEQTWRFLRSRLQEGKQVDRILGGSGDLSNLAKETFSATFATCFCTGEKYFTTESIVLKLTLGPFRLRLWDGMYTTYIHALSNLANYVD